jgi:Zn-dependent M28 family amino/carboxypeptidase
MIGRLDFKHEKDSNYVYVIGSDMLSTDLHQLSELTQKVYAPALKLDYRYNDINDPNQFYYRSDHYNFAKHNIPVIFYFTGVHEDYHRPTDDPEKIHYRKTADIARLVFFTAWELANGANRPRVNKKQ